MIAAFAKAESLSRIAGEQGAPRSEFAVALTKGEAFELLDYLTGEAGQGLQGYELLMMDAIKARVQDDPWPVLANFQLLGFDIVGALQ